MNLEKTNTIGGTQPDGTIFAGYLPDGRLLFAAPADSPGLMTWTKADAYAKALDAHGHKDWRLPTRLECLILFEHKDVGEFKGTFVDTSDSGDAHWYWSSTEVRDVPSFVWLVRFSVGDDVWHGKDNVALSSRVVRAELPA